MEQQPPPPEARGKFRTGERAVRFFGDSRYPRGHLRSILGGISRRSGFVLGTLLSDLVLRFRSTGIRTGWYGFVVCDGLRHLKPFLIEVIAILEAVSLDAYAAPRQCRDTRAGPPRPLDSRSRDRPSLPPNLIWQQTHFHPRPSLIGFEDSDKPCRSLRHLRSGSASRRPRRTGTFVQQHLADLDCGWPSLCTQGAQTCGSVRCSTQDQCRR